jgi:hypothetical protein
MASPAAFAMLGDRAKLYLSFVVPLHHYGVPKLMANALAARRL